MHKLFSLLFLLLIRGYQLFVSPLLAGHCRHHPTCSQYAIVAIGDHGAIRGMWLTAKRLFRCQPWGSSGFDPVPPPYNKTQEKRLQNSGKRIAPRHSQRYIRPSTFLPIRENDI